VPASGHGIEKAADPDAAKAHSSEHMLKAVEKLRGEGFDVEGQVGDGDPLAAVQDAVTFGEFDEVVVSTLPVRASRWLKMDLPTRVERVTGLPVTHVETKHAD
jgi:GABA permease